MRIKELLILSLLVVIYVAVVQTAYADGTSPNIWLFEEGSGSSEPCVPNYVNTATLQNGAGWSSDTPRAYSNYSLDLDGTNDYVSTPLYCRDDAETEGWRTISVEAWVKPDSVDTGYSFIVNADWLQAFSLNLYGSTIEAFVVGFNVTAPDTIVIGEWTHLAMTYDRYAQGQNLKLYINGNLAAAKRAEGPALNWDWYVYIGMTNYNLTGDPLAPNYAWNFDGKIDDVVVTRDVISGARIKFDYENGPLAVFTPEGALVDTINLGAAIEWDSEYGFQYQVEWSPDEATWEARSSVFYGTGGTMKWNDTTTTSFHQPGQGYYRVMQLNNYFE